MSIRRANSFIPNCDIHCVPTNTLTSSHFELNDSTSNHRHQNLQPTRGLRPPGEDVVVLGDHILEVWTVRREPDILPKVHEKTRGSRTRIPHRTGSLLVIVEWVPAYKWLGMRTSTIPRPKAELNLRGGD